MSKFVERLKNIGPGALVAAAFIGPGTVTTCTKSGANSGYTLLWAMLFSTIATIVFQEMAARLGIVTQKGLGENIRERIVNPVLKGIAILIVSPAVSWVCRLSSPVCRHGSWCLLSHCLPFSCSGAAITRELKKF